MNPRIVALSLAVMLTSMTASSSLAQTPAAAPAPFAPGVRYSDAIPTLEQVLGHAPGAAITPPDGVVTYLKALAQAAPTRTRLIEYGRTWEGRPLVVLVVASAERMAQLDAVQKGLQRLADPRVLDAGEEDRLVDSLPVAVWLMHAVHGNEISSVDAALLEAYHLLAAQDDPQVTQILREALVLIDPLENPDGRARFVASNAQAMGPFPDAEPFAAEHNEPWPGGRANHYLFDMNRDWFAQSQAETRGRTKFFLQWFPQVVVDLHEMSGDSSYYFAPPADPLNPHITPQQIGWFNTIGKANAAKFDERGFAYFNREVYDSFYPGYGESWPIFHGAIGMTYEMASARGLTWRRTDEDVLTYRDGVLRHFTSAITTLATSAANRQQLLRDFVAYRRSAIADGDKGKTRAWLIPVGVDPARAHRFAQLLRDQGFDVLQSTEAITIGTRTLAAGHLRRARGATGRPPAAEPARPVDCAARGVREGAGSPSQEAPSRSDVRRDRMAPALGVRRRGAGPGPTGHDGAYAADGRVAARHCAAPPRSATCCHGAWEQRAWWWPRRRLGCASDLPTRASRSPAAPIHRAPRSSVRPRTLPTSAATMSRLVTEHRAEIVAIDSAFTEAGISLGSNEVVALKAPRVLLAWDAPTSSQSAGWARYVLERRFAQRVTAVRVSALAQADLTRFDVVVLPSGNYSPALTGPTLQRLKDWVSAGGTLITIAEATRWATRDGVNLLDTTAELRDGRPESSGGGGRRLWRQQR